MPLFREINLRITAVESNRRMELGVAGAEIVTCRDEPRGEILWKSDRYATVYKGIASVIDFTDIGALLGP